MGSFGYRLKKIREERGFTQERLAVACKTSEPVIRHYEKERKKPGYDMMLRICDALRVNPDYLMQDDLSLNPYEEKMRLLTPSPSYRLKAISCLKILLNRSVIRIEKDRGRSSWIKNI